MVPHPDSLEVTRLMDRFRPEVASVARSALDQLRGLLPGAIEFVYDKSNALVIGFGPTERPSDAILSIALYSRWVNLYFLQGADLPDPQKRLIGAGNIVRRIKLETIATLDDPSVRSLIAEALKQAPARFDRRTPRRTIIRSVAARKRPRR